MRRTFFLTNLIHFVVGLAELVLLLRIILLLFAANPANAFAQWVFSTSSTLLTPFRGIFTSTTITTNHVLDFTALFALVIYALLGSLLIYLANILENVSTASDSKSRKNKA